MKLSSQILFSDQPKLATSHALCRKWHSMVRYTNPQKIHTWTFTINCTHIIIYLHEKKRNLPNHGSNLSKAGTSMIERPSNSSKSTLKIPDLSPKEGTPSK